jgi:hypothetical protein
MNFRFLGLVAGLSLLSGCAASTSDPAVRPKASKPVTAPVKGKRPPKFIPAPGRAGVARPPMTGGGPALDRVMGADARALVQLFGAAKQDVREEGARKLQFANQFCILDAYLYPSARGRTPVVTYVSARTPDGRDAERNSCITALQTR